jgi:hypothetical protein
MVLVGGVRAAIIARALATRKLKNVAILRRHLLDKVPISDLCEELGLQPTVFYRCQKEFFENGAVVFQGKNRPNPQAEQQRIEFLEKKIQRRGAGRTAKKKSWRALSKCGCRTMCGTW